MPKIPNPIDIYVGSRVRMRRVLLRMSQEKLGEALGVTFQQIQKYEKGVNRIGASRLQHMAAVLQVQPSYFFEGAPSYDLGAASPHLAVAEDGAAYVTDFLSTVEGHHLSHAFVRIKDPKVRRRIVDLVTSLAGEQEKVPESPEAK